MKKAYLLDLKNDHFEKVANFIYPFYEENPLDFLFIAPSGFYTKQIAERIASKTNSTINRNAFTVINQYITELLRFYEPDAIILDRDFLKVYLENEIIDLIESEKKDEEFSQYLNVISNSQKSVEYLLDIFEKKWEISRVQDEKVVSSSEEYKILDNSINVESHLYKLYSKLEKSLEDVLSTKFDMSIKYQRNYDPISVYKWFYEIFPEILKKEDKKYLGKRVIISGFFDISPIINKTFSVLFKLFEEVHFITWFDIQDRAFESIRNIHHLLKDEGFVFDNRYTNEHLKDVYDDTQFYFVPVRNEIAEIEYVSKEIKSKLINEALSPDDFGIVVPNISVARLVSDYLDEIKVPNRLKNDIPLSESQMVLILLQPIKTLVKGCEVEDLLAMVEGGYGGKTELTIDEIEYYLKKINLFYDIPKASLNQRKDKWLTTIENEINKKFFLIKSTEESERVQIELNELLELQKCFQNIFDILKEVQQIEKKKTGFTISDYRELIRKWIEKDNINFNIVNKYLDVNSIESEINAIKTFEILLLNVEKSLEKIIKGDKKNNLDKFYKIISSLTQINTFRVTELYANCVEIMSLEDSRFVKKRYKYFIDFTEDNYPSIKVNPFLSSLDNQGVSMSKFSEKISRRNLFISMIFAENIVFTYAKAQLNGDPIVPSPYEKEMRQTFKNIHYSDNFLFIKGNLPKEPNNIYSEREAIIYYLLNDKKEFLPEQFLVESKRFVEQINNHSWNLSNKTELGKLSHTKISTYVDCPFKFYLSQIVHLKGDKDFNIFFEGLIKHRSLKELFSKYSDYPSMLQKYSNYEEIRDEIKLVLEDIWDDYVDDFFYTYQAIKEVVIEQFIEDLYGTIETILENYIQIDKDKKLTFSQVLETEVEVKTSLDVGIFENVELETRIDRIDLLNGNFLYLWDSFDNKLLPGTYSIVDYKNSNSFQSEQLLVYYLALINSKEWKNKLIDHDVFLKFHLTKKDDINKKFIKIQKDKIIYPEFRKKAKYVSFDFKEFEVWLENILKNIDQSQFTPVCYIESKIKRFFKEMREKYNCADSNEKEYNCLNNYASCQFKSLCQLLNYKDGFKNIINKNY
ncbi:MAG TPA: PD-(D/E)XK nuclease family protein [Defluviitoga tunisiensis]|nr:PD-(D/E)XK nuclease family protein [Defluviitoga tunisiensis]